MTTDSQLSTDMNTPMQHSQPPPRGSRAQLAFVTALTVSRIPLVLLFLVCCAVGARAESPWWDVAGLVLMVLSAVSDLFDGMLARKWNVTTRFGALCDPLADKAFYVVVFPALTARLFDFPPAAAARLGVAENPEFAHASLMLFFTVFYLLRDQWVSFLRAAAAGVSTKADMRAGWSGKIRTALSFPIGCLLYAYVAFHWGWLSRPLMMGIEVFGLLVNFYSVYDYTKRYGFAFRENMRK